MTGSRIWRTWPLLSALAALLLLAGLSSPLAHAASQPHAATDYRIALADTPTPAPTVPPVDGDDDPDIDKYAFLTIGAAGVGAVVLTLGYLFRKRIGYEPHKPGEGDDHSHH